MAQSVERLTSAQVMISWFVGSSPASGSVLTAWSLEPDWILCLLLSLSFFLSLFLRERTSRGGAGREWDRGSEVGS